MLKRFSFISFWFKAFKVLTYLMSLKTLWITRRGGLWKNCYFKPTIFPPDQKIGISDQNFYQMEEIVHTYEINDDF